MVLVPIFALSSCGLPYCIKVPFSESDLVWMSPYQVGDTLIFEDDINFEDDTIIVTRKAIYNPTNTFILDPCGCKWWNGDNEFKALAVYDMEARHKGNSYDGGVTLRKVSDDKPAYISVYIFEMFTNNAIAINNAVAYVADFPQYRQTIVIPKTNLHQGKYFTGIPINAIYWNRDAGLIGYRTPEALYKLKEVRHAYDIGLNQVNDTMNSSKGSKWTDIIRTLFSFVLP